MPGMNGDQLAAAVKELCPTVPVIMLSARGAEMDKVMGLELAGGGAAEVLAVA